MTRLGAIIEATGASTYHGFLPSLVRDCVVSFTSLRGGMASLGTDEFPLTFATALFSFLYHLATYEASKTREGGRGRGILRLIYISVCLTPLLYTLLGGDALVGSGVMESLIQVLEWKAFEPSNITVS